MDGGMSPTRSGETPSRMSKIREYALIVITRSACRNIHRFMRRHRLVVISIPYAKMTSLAPRSRAAMNAGIAVWTCSAMTIRYPLWRATCLIVLMIRGRIASFPVRRNVE